MTEQHATPARSALPWYLASSGLWMAAMSLQGFLFTWLLVGILERPADEVGYARFLTEMPPLLILLVGGLIGDRVNGRRFLSNMHLLMTIPPAVLAWVYLQGDLNYAWVVAFGISVASIQAFSDPNRQATISRVSRIDVQRSITLMTVIGSLVGIGGFYIGGQLEQLGLATVLLVQAGLFFVGIFAVAQMPSLPAVAQAGGSSLTHSITLGVKQVWRIVLIRNLIGLNLFSSLFNAGAYIIAIPFIAKEIYGGDANFLANLMIFFTVGAVSSNIVLLGFMPLKFPGRLFLFMQITRMLILLLVWLQPTLWLFYLAILAWGFNMGVTTTLVRTTVQEIAPAQTRAQILSILLLSFLVASPISSLLLGELIAHYSPLAAMIPGMVISVIIFVVGVFYSGLWQYQFHPKNS